MNKNKNSYIILYATVMVVIVAAVLSLAATSLAPMQAANVKTEKMMAILNSIGEGKDAASAPDKKTYVEAEYDKFIVNAFCVDAAGNKVESVSADDVLKQLDNLPAVFAAKSELPVFEAKLSDGELLYVVPTTGKGLWGDIWGYIALKSDCNTVYGAILDHKSETPGLGAEIATPEFSAEFVGKEIFKGGKYVGITLTKGVGSSVGNPNAVDAVTGGTLTSNGVTNMLVECLGDYVPFFDKVKGEL